MELIGSKHHTPTLRILTFYAINLRMSIINHVMTPMNVNNQVVCIVIQIVIGISTTNHVVSSIINLS